MASGLKDFSITFGSRVIVLLLGIGTQSCLAWILGTGDRGSLAVCMIYATLLTVIFTLGSDVAGEYFVATKKMNISVAVTNVFISGGLGILAALCVGEILLHTSLEFTRKVSLSSLRLSLVLIPLSFFSNTFMILLGSLREFKWMAIVSTSSLLVQFLFTVVLVWVFNLGVNGSLLSVICTGVVTIIAILAIFRYRHGYYFALPVWQNIKEMFHYGIRYYFGKLSNETNYQIGSVIMIFFASRDEVGVFAVATMLVSRVMMIPDSLGTVLFPRVAVDKAGRSELIASVARVTLIVTGIILLFMSVLAKPIVFILFSSKFESMVPLIPVLAAGVLVRSSCKTFVPFLNGTNHPGISSMAVAIGTALNLMLLFWLMPMIGIMGAAVAMTASYFVSSVFLYVGFSRVSGLGFKQIWGPSKADWSALMPVWRQSKEICGSLFSVGKN